MISFVRAEKSIFQHRILDSASFKAPMSRTLIQVARRIHVETVRIILRVIQQTVFPMRLPLVQIEVKQNLYQYRLRIPHNPHDSI